MLLTVQVPPHSVLPAVPVPADRGPVRQDLTKWNGDHALNGGNKEWAEEDGALHAFNMVPNTLYLDVNAF